MSAVRTNAVHAYNKMKKIQRMLYPHNKKRL